MAFTGAPTIKVVSSKAVRITGVSLAGGASGTIGLAATTVAKDIVLPKSFAPHAYDNAERHQVDVADSVQVTINRAGASANATPIQVAKTGGQTTHVTGKDFFLTLTNGDAMNATPALEIYVHYLGD